MIALGAAVLIGGCSGISKESNSVDRNNDTMKTNFSEEDLEGVWLDQHGPFLKVDDGKMYFIRDCRYLDIINVDDNEILVKANPTNAKVRTSDILPDEEFELTFIPTSKGHMELMGYPLFRSDTTEGKAAEEKIDEIVSSNTFYADYEEGYEIPVTIDEFTLTMSTRSWDIDSNCGLFELENGDKYYIYYNKLTDDEFYLISEMFVYRNSEEIWNVFDILDTIWPEECYFYGDSSELMAAKVDHDELIFSDVGGENEVRYEFDMMSFPHSRELADNYMNGNAFDWVVWLDFTGDEQIVYLYSPWSLEMLYFNQDK